MHLGCVLNSSDIGLQDTMKPPNSGHPKQWTCFEQQAKCLVPNLTIFVKLPPNSGHPIADKFFKTHRGPLFRGFTIQTYPMQIQICQIQIFQVNIFWSSRRLQEVLRITIIRLRRCLQDVFKRFCQTSWKTKTCYAEEVLKTSSRPKMFAA